MVRRMSCILSIKGTRRKANCSMQTAEFFYYKKNSAVILLFVVKDGKLLALWHLLRKRYDRLKRILNYFLTINNCYLYYEVKVTKRFSTLFYQLLYSTPNIHVLVRLHQT